MQRFNTYTIKFEDENIFELMSYRFYKILFNEKVTVEIIEYDIL